MMDKEDLLRQCIMELDNLGWISILQLGWRMEFMSMQESEPIITMELVLGQMYSQQQYVPLPHPYPNPKSSPTPSPRSQSTGYLLSPMVDVSSLDTLSSSMMALRPTLSSKLTPTLTRTSDLTPTSIPWSSLVYLSHQLDLSTSSMCKSSMK